MEFRPYLVQAAGVTMNNFRKTLLCDDLVTVKYFSQKS